MKWLAWIQWFPISALKRQTSNNDSIPPLLLWATTGPSQNTWHEKHMQPENASQWAKGIFCFFAPLFAFFAFFLHFSFFSQTCKAYCKCYRILAPKSLPQADSMSAYMVQHQPNKTNPWREQPQKTAMNIKRNPSTKNLFLNNFRNPLLDPTSQAKTTLVKTKHKARAK